jgi:predicted nuclease of predicted toxin-antitoxin system
VSRTWFTDRDLGKQFPRILADAGIAVERHGDLFPPDGSDEQWLEYCGTRGRVAITHNSRIRYVPNELAAVLRFKVPLVVVVGKVPTAELARNFVRTLHRIEAMLDDHAPPMILKVYRASASELAHAADAPGRVEVWFPKA